MHFGFDCFILGDEEPFGFGDSASFITFVVQQESRIYQVASTGLHSSCNSLASSVTGPKSLDIPIFTAVHGRAAKVTSVAGGESSDESSDGETATPKADGSHSARSTNPRQFKRGTYVYPFISPILLDKERVY